MGETYIVISLSNEETENNNVEESWSLSDFIDSAWKSSNNKKFSIKGS